VSPDGRLGIFAAGQNSMAVALIDLQENKEFLSIRKGELLYVRSVAFAPSGKQFLFCTAASLTRLFSLKDGDEVGQLEGSVACFSPDSKRILTGKGNELLLFDAANQREIQRFKGHTAPVTALAYSADGRFVVSGSEDKTARLWEVATGKVVHT